MSDWSGGSPECPEVVKMLSQISGSGLEALLDVRNSSEDPTGCLGVVGRPYKMSAIGQETLGSPGVVKWSSRMSGSGQEALLDVREWSGGPSRCPGVVGRPS